LESRCPEECPLYSRLASYGQHDFDYHFCHMLF
jgi:hypothetical protein